MTARRLRGDGSVYFNQRRNVWIGKTPPDAHGRRRQVTGTTETEAAAKLRALWGAPAQVRAAALPPQRSLAALLEDWQRTLTERAMSTRLDYEQICRDYLVPALGTVTLDRLDTPTIVAALEAMVTRGELADANRPKRTLSAALAWGRLRGYLPTNPLQDVRLPRYRRPVGARFDDDDVHTTLAAIAGQPIEPVVLFELFTGMRPSEAYALAWESVDLIARTAVVCATYSDKDPRRILPLTKTDASARTVALNDGAVGALRLSQEMQATWTREGVPARHRRGAGASATYVNAGGFAFTNTQGGHWTYAAVVKAFRTPRASLSPKDLRKAFATAAVDSVPLEIARAAMGHAPRSTVLARHYDQGRGRAASLAGAEAIGAAIRQRFLGEAPPPLRVVDVSRRVGG